ncbi:MAG: response regulator [Rubrobacteraceae bacterium]
MSNVLAAVEDLLFKSKISGTADSLGVAVRFPRSPRKLLESLRDDPPGLLILDLNSDRFEPLQLLQAVNSDETLTSVRTLGFLSHVQKDLAVAAREAGCDRIMARSAFTKNLPEILTGEDTGATDGAGVGG